MRILISEKPRISCVIRTWQEISDEEARAMLAGVRDSSHFLAGGVVLLLEPLSETPKDAHSSHASWQACVKSLMASRARMSRGLDEGQLDLFERPAQTN